MPKQRFGLGRGLDALIPGAGGSSVTHVADDIALDTSLAASALFEVPLDAISPNPQQPRTPESDSDPALRDLADSIREYGLLQPLLVAEDGIDEHGQPAFVLIAGERRWRAARLAALERVPVVIRDATPQLQLEMALVENIQRADLHPLEAAQAYVMLNEEYGLSHSQIGERIGKSAVAVSNTIRLLNLPLEVRELLIRLPKIFTEGHARAILQIVGDAERIEAAKQIIAQGMSVRQAEELARRYGEAALHLTADRRGGAPQRSFETRRIEEEITRAVELKARLQRNTRGRGTLTLYFNNEDQLQVLYDRLVSASAVVDAEAVPRALPGGPGDPPGETRDLRYESLDDRA